MAAKKTAFMKWVDRKIVKDASLRRLVEENLAEMRIEQEFAALRERRGMTQRELADRMGVSQPAIAKLESGRVKNLELRTLFRWATALGRALQLVITAPTRRSTKEVARRRRIACSGKASPMTCVRLSSS